MREYSQMDDKCILYLNKYNILPNGAKNRLISTFSSLSAVESLKQMALNVPANAHEIIDKAAAISLDLPNR